MFFLEKEGCPNPHAYFANATDGDSSPKLSKYTKVDDCVGFVCPVGI